MKNTLLHSLITIYLFSIPTLLFTMQEETCIVTVAVFDKNTAATGSNEGCFLVTNCQEIPKDHAVICLNSYPTHNLIADKKNQLLGVFNTSEFVVYDIKTKNIIWSKKTYSDNCSATFSPNDGTIFLCDNGYLSTNENVSMNLPYTGSNKYFTIECHPQKKELLYPRSNTTLAIYSFENKTYTQHPLFPGKTDIITRALYSPDGDHIALLTNKQNIAIYNLKNNSTVWVRGTLGLYSGCFNPIFIPCSHVLFFLTDKGRSGHYFDVEKMHSLATQNTQHDFAPEKNNFLTNKVDFSLDGSYLLTATGSSVAQGYSTHNVITNFLKHQKLFSYYQQLKLYSIENRELLIPDVIRLLIQKLIILFSPVTN